MIKRATARWPLVLLFVVFTEAITLTNAQTPEKAGILRPTDQAVLETEEVQVICSPRRSSGWTANPSKNDRHRRCGRLFLFESQLGRHELIWKNGDTHQRIQFVVRTSANTVVPTRVGKLTGRILLRQNVRAVTRANSREISRRSPLQRHASPVTSKALLQPVTPTTMKSCAECVLCHNPHGSTEKFHLKMTRETACKQCHG